MSPMLTVFVVNAIVFGGLAVIFVVRAMWKQRKATKVTVPGYMSPGYAPEMATASIVTGGVGESTIGSFDF